MKFPKISMVHIHFSLIHGTLSSLSLATLCGYLNFKHLQHCINKSHPVSGDRMHISPPNTMHTYLYFIYEAGQQEKV